MRQWRKEKCKPSGDLLNPSLMTEITQFRSPEDDPHQNAVTREIFQYTMA